MRETGVKCRTTIDRECFEVHTRGGLIGYTWLPAVIAALLFRTAMNKAHGKRTWPFFTKVADVINLEACEAGRRICSDFLSPPFGVPQLTDLTTRHFNSIVGERVCTGSVNGYP